MKRAIRDLVKKEKVDVICIQESKMEVLEVKLAEMLWGMPNCGWCFKPSVGRSGGIIMLWNKRSFEVESSFQGTGFLELFGKWGSNKIPCSIVGVYSPCDDRGKRSFWQEVIARVECNPGHSWCFLGDFNAVKSPEVRRGVIDSSSRKEMEEFQEFQDLPLCGNIC